MSHQQSEVQADAEFGIVLRQLHGFIETKFVHHQARGGQNAFAMGADDGLVHGTRKAEVVRGDDETARHWVWSSGFSRSGTRLKAELRTRCLQKGLFLKTGDGGDRKRRRKGIGSHHIHPDFGFHSFVYLLPRCVLYALRMARMPASRLRL